MVSYTPIRMAEFKSNYGPKYHAQPNLAGYTAQSAFRIASRLAMYGAPAAVGVLLFANGIPRVQRDILQKIPFLGGFFRKEIHPADNDEVFHIPQAQKYCQGLFLEWDDKITTPPGLYLTSLVTPGVVQRNGYLGYACSVQNLRAFNVFALAVLAYLALQCRREIEARLYEASFSTRLRNTSQYALHTAFNIALFPLLFFFSGLYYTDVASTAAVLAAYLNHLKRMGQDQSSVLSDLETICLGVFTLCFRQTNVFWVVVFMGGLEAVHAIKTLRPKRVDQPVIVTLSEQLKYYAWRYSLGEIHDPPLHEMFPDDMIFCVLSLGIAALCNPIRVVRQIWPYFSTLVLFGIFVVWNGGVVLGDKSNHVATIHLPQMLYIWPFFAFFSLPLLLPYALPLINALPSLLPTLPTVSVARSDPGEQISSWSVSSSSGRPGKHISISDRDVAVDSPPNTEPQLSKELQFFGLVFGSKIFLWPLYLLGTILLSFAIVRYNTIIHPFTLADNRHYMFYVFRYTIRRASWIRYVLVIPYTVARWMTWGTMAGCSQWFMILHGSACSTYSREGGKSPFLSHPAFTNRGSTPQQTDVAFPAEPKDLDAAQEQELSKALEEDPLLASIEPATTSTGLIFLLATTLSLMTAPLVEPRYFIIPWVIWRLLVPAWRLHDHYNFGVVATMERHPKTKSIFLFFQRYDLRLILETLWFIAINVATGYIFLTKPYVWRAEDGTVLDGGRFQRFMW
ncbi:alpha-1,2 glucosyltransferase alg10 [Fusarium longipes]|uniref:Dol-P-Glc:Glc(2)Man(9)GlcNAc(2)-PP-Dol alpha-1,2-glucosyltransferase n=1 Tax=Fusarium longipes TaxID=694270 RepID=A0A395SPD9_9HYPO|nr:alpha-1,2 glucosyltransferase alg10 [Fusarium longipes]